MTAKERPMTADVDRMLLRRAGIDERREDRGGPGGIERRGREQKPKRSLMQMIDNGIGLRLSRLMIIAGFPVMATLGGYAFNQTMGRLGDKFDQQHSDTLALTDAVKNLHADVQSLSDKLVQAQIDIAKLQAQAEAKERR